jgi:hypothetical protein
MLGRFVGDPELGATDGELSDYGTVILEKKQFGGVKGGFVELDRLGSTAYGQHRGDGGLRIISGF